MNKDLVEFLYGMGLGLAGAGIGSVLQFSTAGAVGVMLAGLAVAGVGVCGSIVNHIAETRPKP